MTETKRQRMLTRLIWIGIALGVIGVVLYLIDTATS
jgi:hypothetical protein